MKNYIGTKDVQAEPITLGEFINKYKRNPYESDPRIHDNNEQGYLVKYEDGYQSWSPRETFERAYRVMKDYDGQSGVFKVDNIKNLVAFIGGDKEHKSVVSVSSLDVRINGKEECGLHFVECNRCAEPNEKIEDFDSTFDREKQSFMFIPHSVDVVDFLIECLESIKDDIKSKNS